MPSCQVYMMETCSYMMKIAFSINNRDMLIVVSKTEKIPLEKTFTSQELSRMGQGLGDQLA